MTSSDKAQQLLASLREVPSTLTDVVPDGARDEEHVLHLEEYLADQRAGLRTRPWGWRRVGAGIGAAAILCGLAAAAHELLSNDLDGVQGPVAPSSAPLPVTPSADQPEASPRAESSEPDTAVADDPAPPRVRSVRRSAPSRAVETPSEESSLAKQNALFAAAVRARRGGQPERALELLNQLSSNYPQSPLLTQAAVERARAERELDRR